MSVQHLCCIPLNVGVPRKGGGGAPSPCTQKHDLRPRVLVVMSSCIAAKPSSVMTLQSKNESGTPGPSQQSFQLCVCLCAWGRKRHLQHRGHTKRTHPINQKRRRVRACHVLKMRTGPRRHDLEYLYGTRTGSTARIQHPPRGRFCDVWDTSWRLRA